MNPVSDCAAIAARRAGLRAACWIALLCAMPAFAAEKLVLAVARTPLSLPIYIAQERGLLAAEGLDAELVECASGYRCLGEVLAGRADVATVGELPLVFHGFERADFGILGTMTSGNAVVRLIAHARSGVSGVRQLAGRRVGLTWGTTSHYFLDSVLLTAGVEPRSVEIVALQPEQLLEALRTGRVDAIAVWEPYAQQTLKALGAQAMPLPARSSHLQTFNLVGGHAQLQSRGDVFVRLMRAVERAERDIAERPSEARALLRRRLQLDTAAVDAVWSTLNYRLRLDQSLITTMEGEARWALREGHVKARQVPNFLPLMHPEPLHRVNPAAVSVAR